MHYILFSTNNRFGIDQSAQNYFVRCEYMFFILDVMITELWFINSYIEISTQCYKTTFVTVSFYVSENHAL